MTKGVFFDLDGTLWNTSKGTVKAANIILKEHELNTIDKQIVDECMGLSREECAKKYVEELRGKKQLEVYDEIENEKHEIFTSSNIKIYPNVEETLKYLKKKGYVLGIVTNAADIEYVYDFYRTSNLEYLFDGGYAAGYLHLSKKDAIKKLKKDLKVDELYYVGDTFVDENATKGVCPFIYASYGFGEVEKYDYIIKKFENLKDIL